MVGGQLKKADLVARYAGPAPATDAADFEKAVKAFKAQKAASEQLVAVCEERAKALTPDASIDDIKRCTDGYVKADYNPKNSLNKLTVKVGRRKRTHTITKAQHAAMREAIKKAAEAEAKAFLNKEPADVTDVELAKKSGATVPQTPFDISECGTGNMPCRALFKKLEIGVKIAYPPTNMPLQKQMMQKYLFNRDGVPWTADDKVYKAAGLSGVQYQKIDAARRLGVWDSKPLRVASAGSGTPGAAPAPGAGTPPATATLPPSAAAPAEERGQVDPEQCGSELECFRVMKGIEKSCEDTKVLAAKGAIAAQDCKEKYLDRSPYGNWSAEAQNDPVYAFASNYIGSFGFPPLNADVYEQGIIPFQNSPEKARIWRGRLIEGKLRFNEKRSSYGSWGVEGFVGGGWSWSTDGNTNQPHGPVGIAARAVTCPFAGTRRRGERTEYCIDAALGYIMTLKAGHAGTGGYFHVDVGPSMQYEYNPLTTIHTGPFFRYGIGKLLGKSDIVGKTDFYAAGAKVDLCRYSSNRLALGACFGVQGGGIWSAYRSSDFNPEQTDNMRGWFVGATVGIRGRDPGGVTTSGRRQ